MSRVKSLLKQVSFQAHKLALRAGILLLPAHYYASVSSIRELESTKQRWAKKSLLPGSSTTLDGQVDTLKRICLPYQSEYAGNEAYRHAVEHEFGPGYGYKEVFPEYVPAPDEDGLAVNAEPGEEQGHFPASIYIETS